MITTKTSMDPATINQFKQAAANSAVTQLQDEMVVGLRSGTTTTLAVAAIGGRVQEGLRIVGVPTSQKTADKARVLSIPLVHSARPPHYRPVYRRSRRGRGGKAQSHQRGRRQPATREDCRGRGAHMIVIVDETKVVSQLGSRSGGRGAVGWKTSAKRLEKHRSPSDSPV